MCAALAKWANAFSSTYSSPLQFYHHQFGQMFLFSGGKIVKTNIEIDGDALSFGIIHQGDALKPVFDEAVQLLRIAMQMPTQEIVVCHLRHRFHESARHELRQHHTLLFCDAVVVFGFYLQKRQFRVEIRAHPEFLPRAFVVLMPIKHTHFFGVEIHGVVCSYALTIDFLHKIMLACHFQKRTHRLPSGHIFRVHAVH